MRAGKKPLAIALEYDRLNTPRVTAKGSGEVATRILEVARKNGIPIEENGELAAALSQVELDQEIPEKLFRAVAEVLGYILRMSGQRR